MTQLIRPENYHPVISPLETQRAIKKIKDYFQQELAYGLNLRRVSAPLFVDPKTGLNDNLNGVERRVTFTLKGIDELEVEVVRTVVFISSSLFRFVHYFADAITHSFNVFSLFDF